MTSGQVPEAAQPVLRAVETARARLDEVDRLPVVAHVVVFDEVHAVLQEALAGLDGG